MRSNTKLENEAALENDALEETEETEPAYSEDNVANETDDQLYDYGFVGMRIKALYDNGGWCVGKVEHYNIVLNEYKVVFDDESVDFIRPNAYCCHN